MKFKRYRIWNKNRRNFMGEFVVGLHHFLILLVWMYFTHYFLVPKENNWKRELQMLPFWLLYFFLTSTVLYFEPFIKLILLLVVVLSTFAYIYVWEPLRFLLALGLILLVSFLSEAIFSIYILVIQKKKMVQLDIADRLFIIPLDFLLHVIIFHWIVKKHVTYFEFIQKYILTIFIFILSQLLLAFLVGINVVLDSNPHLLAMVFLLILSATICNYLLWKKRDLIIADIQKQKYENQYLKDVYRKELEHYIEVKEELDMHTALRHDLLNEIQIIAYMEKQ